MASPREPSVRPPVLRVTRFDQVIAGVLAVFAALVFAFGSVTTVWLTNRTTTKVAMVPVELVELPGGDEDGSPDETLRVDSPDPERADAAPEEENAEQTEIEQSLETVIEMSEAATELVQQQFEVGVRNVGVAGSAKGTGRRGLGVGPGIGGIPREQRWYVRFGDRLTVDEYAKQLEFFGIELGVLLPDGRLGYVSKLTQPAPAVRYTTSGAAEQRLYMSWQGGERRKADLELIGRAGLKVPFETTVLHFYPTETETMLARLEHDYLNRPVAQIKRTYFAVERDGAGYKFTVTGQTAHAPKVGR